jgi:hypothetical protein
MRAIRWVCALMLLAALAPVTRVPVAQAAVAVGADFDGDGFADLAVGVPGESVAGNAEAGVVQVLYGSAAGLAATGNQLLRQGDGGQRGLLESFDRFGDRVAWGNFDDDVYDDLAIGAPGEAIGGSVNAGAVFIVFGSATGLDPASTLLVHQGYAGVPGAAEPGDLFGKALAVGDFDDNGADDLAVGVPHEDLGSRADAGAVVVTSWDPGTRSPVHSRLLTQDAQGVPGAPEAGDWFGWSLAAGDLGDPVAYPDDPDDLAVGAMREDVGSVIDAGSVTLVFGGPNGLTFVTSRLLTQGSPGVPGAPEYDDRFGQALAVGPLAGGGSEDLAVGAPGEVVAAYESEGFVVVLPAQGIDGPTGAGALGYRQGAGGVGGAPFELDSFGAALEIADVRGDPHHELVVGAPYDSVAPLMYTGSFHILVGTAAGPTGVGSLYLQQGSNGVPGVLETADSFGITLWSGDFDGDFDADLVVGAPTEDHSGVIGAGAVIELENDGTGVPSATNRIWSQQSTGIAGTAELHDNFGWH